MKTTTHVDDTPAAHKAPAPQALCLRAVIQKELRRFFTDARMVIATVLMPGLLIYLLYSFMGSAISSNLTMESTYEPQMYAVNLPESLAAGFLQSGLEFTEISASEAEAVKEQIAAKLVDLLAVFPENFDESMTLLLSSEQGAVNNGEAVPETVPAAPGTVPEATPGTTTEAVPEVSLFYNSTRVESGAVYHQTQYLLDAYKETLRPVFTVNISGSAYDLASQEDTAGFLFASLLPMLLLVFLFSGCMAIAPESIAGEKERGTIATLLVTPLKRWELALGKIASLSLIALLSGASSFIGVMLALPNLLGVSAQEGTAEQGASTLVDASIYSAQDYFMLLAVILSTVLVFVGLISIISAFARTIKEANVLVMPLMIVVFLVGASAMFQTSSSAELVLHLIPVYNSVQCLVAIFGFSAEPLSIVLTVATNTALTGLCIVALTRMFESERVVFSK